MEYQKLQLCHRDMSEKIKCDVSANSFNLLGELGYPIDIQLELFWR
jgi:hypothetical protein